MPFICNLPPSVRQQQVLSKQWRSHQVTPRVTLSTNTAMFTLFVCFIFIDTRWINELALQTY